MDILLCDDILNNANELARLLESSGFDFNVVVFQNGNDALEHFHTGAPIDLCILDIIMPKMNGIDLAKRLRQDGYTGEIVFLSASREYAPESYEVKAFSYLLKPPNRERVNAMLDELFEKRDKADTSKILLKVSGGVKSVPLRNIAYIEAVRHKVYFWLADGSEIAIYTTFGEVAAELLSDSRFAQCHRSYIVNMESIAEISKREIIMHNGARIAVSRTYSDMQHKYFRREFGGMRK